MKRFIKKLNVLILPILVLFLIGLILPPTPRASKSFLFATIKKDSLLLHTKSPRIIFIGGSNISFGLNSSLIKDSLKLNPVNTGVMADLGLKYMIDNTLQYIQEGDIVVLIPEYQHFFRAYSYGAEELLRTVFDVDRKKAGLIGAKQWINLMPHVPKYALTKFNPREYWRYQESDVYHVDSYNEYGDTDAHYELERRPFIPFKIKGTFDKTIMKNIDNFNQKVKEKNARLLVSYPGYQDLSYNNYANKIEEVERQFLKNNFEILGNPERYKFPDSLFFNTPYHTTKYGVDYRTQLFIEDFKENLSKNQLAASLSN